MYALEVSTYRRLKSNLTRALNSCDPVRVLAACLEARTHFQRDGYPDDWHCWQRAADEAFLKIRLLLEDF
jgi:hypothetical protein